MIMNELLFYAAAIAIGGGALVILVWTACAINQQNRSPECQMVHDNQQARALMKWRR